jgi:hypothetical protein
MKLVVASNPLAKKVLEKLINSDKLPITAAWKIKKIVIEYNKHATDYSQAYNDLVKKYAVRDENGEVVVDEKGTFNLDKAQNQVFGTELLELLNVEVEMPTVKIHELGTKLEGITPDELMLLDGVVID